ncbi:MAG: 2-oxoacid:acceptor oxidoreductase family protein [Peptococcaceae bacterium]|nr:2-oxoacid:acceptor oxidoreductase family protein [Peptococcaceae bacterium]
MLEEVLVAGFGGQGVLFTGQLLAYAGMLEGREVAWIPSYGAEMRGGTAHCVAIISDEEIFSPVVEKFSSALIFNLPSLLKFESRIKPGGLLLINSSLVKIRPKRGDIKVFWIPANELAIRAGLDRAANMVMLGAYLEAAGVLPPEAVIRALEKVLPPHRRHTLPVNRQAMQEGAESVRLIAAGGKCKAG